MSRHRGSVKRRIWLGLLWSLALALIAPFAWLMVASGRPIPTLRFAGTDTTASVVVIVLPGIYDGLESLKNTGMATSIQRAMPQAEVILTGASPVYYFSHRLVARLERDVIAPARARGAKEIWLVGASLGGFGALLYERAHPGEVAGIALLAPFMGRPGYWRAIAAGGGLAQWTPGAALPWWHMDQTPHDIWTRVRDWRSQARADRIWVACGSEDAFLTPARLIAEALPAGHFLEMTGGHESALWPSAAEQLLSRARVAAVPDLVHQVEAAHDETSEPAR